MSENQMFGLQWQDCFTVSTSRNSLYVSWFLHNIKTNSTSYGQPIDTFAPNWTEHRFAPFPVQVKVRSPAHAALIEREGKVAAGTKY
jgi:hypothetical protein